MPIDDLSTDPAEFGIDQPPDQGSREASQMLSGLGAQAASDLFAGLAAFAANSAAQGANEARKVPFAGITLNPDGTISFKNVDPDIFRDLMQAKDFQRNTLGGFAKQAKQLEIELARAQAQPWQQLGTALAANMANQPNMPGWVRGLGQTAAQMNPTVDQLRAQYLGVLGKGSDIAREVRNEEIAQQRTNLEAAREVRLGKYEEAMMGMEQKRFNRLEHQDKMKAENDVQERWDDRAAKGLFNAQSYAKELKAANPDIKDEEVAALVSGKRELATQATALREQLGKEGFEKYKKEQGVKFENEKRMAEIDHQNRMAEIALKEKGSINPKTGKPFTQFELKEIAEIESTGILVGNLERDLERRPDLFGPMPWTRASTWVKSWLDEDASRVRADYAHALPIMVQLLREGTRGYARNQREWVESKVPTTADTPERLKGKLAFIKGFLEARTKGLDQVFLVQQMAQGRRQKGESVYAVPSHTAAPQEEVWTAERVKAEREKKSGGQ